MKFRLFPKRIRIQSEDDETVDIEVMFISKKLFNEGKVEVFVAVGYDADDKIHEAFLNDSEVLEVTENPDYEG
jgi:hypothetical protein